MKTLKVGSLFLLSLLWLGPSLGFAEPPEGRPDMEEKMKRIHAKLNLTPEQEQKLKEHRQMHREAGKKTWEAIREKREALETEMAKPAFDEARVKALHGEIAALRNQMADHRLAGILEVRKILTPEQFAKFQEMTREHREKRGDKMRERMKERRENRAK